MKCLRYVALLLVLIAPASVRGEDPPAAKAAEPSQEELERQFSEKMTGATLVGQFTVSNMNDGKPLAQDRYTLGKVQKLPSGFWSFEAHIQYGDKNVKLPLALPVKWAGDTPVITVTNVAFPGLGTYSARVLFYGNSYAGTWNGKDHGGEMWGRIVPAGETPPPAEEKPANESKSAAGEK